MMLSSRARRQLQRAVFAFACLLLAWPCAAWAQISAEESAQRLKPAEGLQATLWASEPLLVNPTTIDIDSRGRVWVTEGLNYRLTRGGNRQFKRIDGADKIKILEDTDGDGKADKATVFADNIFPVPMGIAIEEHWSKDGKYEGAKVFVGNSPDLLVLEDTDGDDKADKRYPLLSGFGGIDSDHGVHGMVLGPDGKLYFTHGDGCCSVQQDHSERQQNFDVVDRSGRRVSTDQLGTVLRCNRDGTQFEMLATRLRNDYECAVDSFGNVFASDNDDDGNRGSRVVWIMDGGEYGYRTPGSPRHWGEEVPGNIPKLAGTGNGSPCGVMIYEGDALPALYRGALLEAEAGPRVINAFPLKRHGAGYRTEQHIMLSSDDEWFRPVDVCAAPDGSLFVADWYDGGVGGHAFRDQTTGRIYRVASKGATTAQPHPDFTTTKGLAEALKSPNIATRDVARRRLSEPRSAPMPQADFAVLTQGRTLPEPHLAARFIWIDHSPADELENSNPALREQVVRMLGRDNSRLGLDPASLKTSPAPAAVAELEDLLGQVRDPDPGVRRELILALRDVPTSQAGDALRQLAASWDGQDRFYLEALGLALRHREAEYLASLFDGTLYGDLDADHAGKDSNVALPPYFPVDRNEAYLKPSDALPPANALSKTLGLMWCVHRAAALPLLAKLMPALESAALQQAASDVIAQVSDPDGAPIVAEMIEPLRDVARRRQVMASLARKLQGPWRSAAREERITRVIDALLDDDALRDDAIALAGSTGDSHYSARLVALLKDEKVQIPSRVAALEALVANRSTEAQSLAEAFVAKAAQQSKADPLSEAALRALVPLGVGSERLGEILQDAEMPLPLRREALRGLAQRPRDAERLLALARSNELATELRLEAATTLRAHPDRGIRDQALELFPIKSKDGKPLPSTGELMRRDGDAERGKQVFFAAETGEGARTSCASCHRVQGAGQWIGPDLSTIGMKYGKEELLRSILNPSAAISYTFRSLVVGTNDGRVVTGLPIEDTPTRLVLKTADGARVALSPATIDERKDAELSLMPEGLTESLGEQDLVDLLAYLTTLKQPVSIAGAVMAAGPFPAGALPDNLQAAVRSDAPLNLGDGKPPHAWSKLTANAEGIATFAHAEEGDYLVHLPISSPVAQTARLVLDATRVEAVWLDGKRIELDPATNVAELRLPAGASDLNVQVWAKQGDGLVVTIVSDQPVSFAIP